jgi:hypothetical protein
MYRRLHMACAESCIVTSRSVTRPVLLHIFLLVIFCQMSRSRHQVDPKTATQVSTVVRGTSPCKTCELFCAGRLSTKIDDSPFPPLFTGSKCSRDSQTATATCSSQVSVRIPNLSHPQIATKHFMHPADDKVRTQDGEEAALFRLLEAVTQRSAASLISRWREPSLTIHSVRGSGPHNPTVIPASITAQVSLRIVPDQVLDAVCAALVTHLRASFDALDSSNTIKVKSCLFARTSHF